MATPSPTRWSPCRRCDIVDVETAMVAASKVLHRANARGFYCVGCAELIGHGYQSHRVRDREKRD